MGCGNGFQAEDWDGGHCFLLPPSFFSFFPFLLDSSRLFSLVIGGWIVRQESSEFWIEISRGKARSIQKGGATGDFFPVE